MIDIFDQQCCQIDCYTLRDCKQANSAQCTETPVECAMGDAYRYTIQPNFKHFNEFQCHVKYQEPKILYKISYRIKVPGPYGPESELETQEIHKVVYANDFAYQSGGHFSTGFLSVEHNAGIDIKDELVLVGKNVHGHEHRKNFTVYSLKEQKDYNQRKVVVHEIANNVFVATTQFNQPFAYSTISWVRDNDCDKDISKFKYQQKHHNTDAQNVYLDIRNADNNFVYKLKSKDNPPTIRFHIPGNMSILPFYFRDNGPLLLTNNSLNVELDLVAGGRIWDIHIKGRMSACPGYLGIVIVDLLEEEELFRYDNVIFCPVDFNMTFKVPNKGRRAERTFDIRFEDSKKTYHVYLTHLLFESEYLKSEPQTNSQLETEESPWAIIAIVITITSILLLVLNLVYAYFEYTKVRALYNKKNENYYKRSSGEERDHIGNGVNAPSTKLTQKQYMFITAYIAFRVLYSLLFTFTVFLGILGVALQNDVLQLSGIREFQRRKYNESKTLAHEIEKYGQDELLRQAELVTNMQGACSNYIEELFDAMLFQVDNITLNLHHHQMYGHTTSISSLVHQWFKHKSKEYDETLDTFADRYKTNFTRDIKPALRSYEKYLQKVYKDDWFQFPQLLYNKSIPLMSRPEVFNQVDLRGPMVDFGAFLPIEEVEDVQLWATQWWERYGRLLPRSPSFPAPIVDPSRPACDVRANMPFLNMSTMARAAKRINSSRFMAPHLPGRSIVGPKLKMAEIREEYKYLIPPESAPQKTNLFTFDEMTESFNLGLLRLVFIILDVLILIYRISRTFMVARTLCQGFDETKMISGKEVKLTEKKQPKEKKCADRQLFDGPSDQQRQTVVGEREYSSNAVQDGTLPDYMTSIDSHRSMLPPPAPNCSNNTQNGNKLSHHYAASSSQRGDPWNKISAPSSLKETILRLLESSTIPKIVMAMLILVLFCFLVNCVSLILSVDMMADVDAFRMFLVGLDVQVNRTNWYLTEQAKHFNTITMSIYKGQMTSELLHFQSLVQYFNTEQQRLVQNYIDEACAIRKGFLGNRSCDINVTPSKLNIPMVPCNFIPIQPRLYSEMNKKFSEMHLGHHFEPILSAIRNIFLIFGYAVIIVAAVMLIIHLTGVVLFHYLKTRHKFPVHRTYVTSIPDVALNTDNKTTQEIAVVAESDEDEEGDEEEEEEVERDIKMKTYAQTATDSPDKMKSLLLKYSETKV
jgi:hypothetical protein